MLAAQMIQKITGRNKVRIRMAHLDSEEVEQCRRPAAAFFGAVAGVSHAVASR